MIKKLTRHGNSLALVIDKAILELLDIDGDTPLSIGTDGTCLVIAPAHEPERRARLREALDEGNRTYGQAMRRLAQ